MDTLMLIKNAIGSKYQILDIVGKGGMATVYKAIHIGLNRTVALKIIHQNLVHDEEFIKRFLREAQTCASLNHPNIVTVYDVDSIDNVHFMSMEYLEGKTLRELIVERGHLTTDEAIHCLLPVAEALAYMHDRKKYHRDVKSSNIIITKTGRPVLMDFGIALVEDSDPLSHVGTILGTPEYMSPEQAKGETRLDGRSDIYSFGMIMYEALTGRLPFQAENYYATLNRIVYDALPTVTSVNPQIPKWLSCIVSGCLIKEREERIQNARELIQALKNKEKPSLPQAKPQISQKTRIPGNNTTHNYVQTDTGKRNYNSRNSSLIIYILATALIVVLFILGWLIFEPSSLNAPAIDKSISDSFNNLAEGQMNSTSDQGSSSGNRFEQPNDEVTRDASDQESDRDTRVSILMSEGDQHFQNNRFQEAFNTFEMILKMDPGNNEARQKYNDSRERLIRALIDSAKDLMEEGSFGAALNDLSRAVKINPDYPGVQQLLKKTQTGQLIRDGQLNLERKAFAKAIENFSEAKRLDPDNPLIDQLLKNVQEAKSNYSILMKLGINEVRLTGNNMDPYWLGTTEVTQKLYEEIMNSNPSYFRNNNLLPVENVNFNEIMIFLNELNRITGMNYRLPTENEWLYGANGGIHSRNYIFSGSNNLKDVAWFDSNSTHVVASKKANEAGLYDMNGNVWEWTSTSQGGMIVTKGGGWFSTYESCNLSNRQLLSTDQKDRYTGFRLCRDE